jgi:hypothetical protein
VDALKKTGIENQVFLTQSFRFGPAIAKQANRVLQALDARLRLKGFDKIDSVIDFAHSPDCYLTRTNASAVRRMLEEIDMGRRPHLMGGGMDVKMFAEGARDLMQGRASTHHDLACFSTWGEVEEYVEQDAQGDELRLLVRLCNDFSPNTIISALDRMPKEQWADVLISTAHKAKGREWHSVKLSDDFPAPKEEGDTIEPAELRLLYVAVTRASHKLDPYSCPMLMSLPQYGSEVAHDESILQITNGVSRQLDAPDAVQVIENHLQEVYMQGVLFSL